MSTALVILAAGVGRRYGGLKQLEGVGPGGETIMDYSAFDARRAGFDTVVFVVREETEAEFRGTIGRRLEGRIGVSYAHQRLDGLPAGYGPPTGRTKPWGTGHAALTAAAHLDGPFAVANADDFYGWDSFAALGEFLRDAESGEIATSRSETAPTVSRSETAPTYAMVGFRLRDTMAEAGAVSRGVCRCTADGWLEHVEEITRIEKDGDSGRYVNADGKAQVLPGDTLVSMNTWGFRPAFIEQLRAAFEEFMRGHGGSTEREFFLPSVVDQLIQAKRARVRVLPTRDRWFGVTHREDKSAVVERIRELTAEGVYPSPLWGD